MDGQALSRSTLIPVLLAVGLTLACSIAGPPVPEGPPPTVEAAQAPPSTPVPEPTPEPTATANPPTPTVIHLVTPGEPPKDQFFISDVSSEADVQRAASGDSYAHNRLERPFSSGDMVFQAGLDITYGGISADDTWVYFAFKLAGPPETGAYAVELDLDGDGRGDLMVRSAAPLSAEWTTDGVQLLVDGNDDVGGASPMEPDLMTASADGYETIVFDQGQGDDPDSAWTRTAKIEGDGIQFAVKRTVIGDLSFLWSGWADAGVNQPGWIDYNDHFSEDEAGSLGTVLAAVASVDNTCRMYYGFTPTGREPGLCAVTGTVRNCSPHPMRMEPGGKMLTPWFEGGAILKNVMIGTYKFYDESTDGTLVLTATLSPGGTITITKTGLGDTYACQ